MDPPRGPGNIYKYIHRGPIPPSQGASRSPRLGSRERSSASPARSGCAKAKRADTDPHRRRVCIYIYIHIYTDRYICVYRYIYMYIYIRHMYTYIYMYMRRFTSYIGAPPRRKLLGPTLLGLELPGHPALVQPRLHPGFDVDEGALPGILSPGSSVAPGKKYILFGLHGDVMGACQGSFVSRTFFPSTIAQASGTLQSEVGCAGVEADTLWVLLLGPKTPQKTAKGM